MSASDDQDRPADQRRREPLFPLEGEDIARKKRPPQPLSPLFAEDEANFPTFAATRLDRAGRSGRDPRPGEDCSPATSSDGESAEQGGLPGTGTARAPAPPPGRHAARPGYDRSPASRPRGADAPPPGRHAARPGYDRSPASRLRGADAPAPAPPPGRPDLRVRPFAPPDAAPGASGELARPNDDERRVVARMERARTRLDARPAYAEDDRRDTGPAGAPRPAGEREAPDTGQWRDPLALLDTFLGPLALALPAEVRHWSKVALIVVVSLAVIIALKGGPGDTPLGRWVDARLNGYEGSAAMAGAVARPVGDYTVEGPPSLTPQQIDAILSSYGSPAAGTGNDWYNLGLRYGIDPAFAVAFFIHESGAGTNPNWAGLKPGGRTTHNIGNIICAGYPTCYGRFRDYSSWAEGIEDWYRLIAVEYIQGRGTRTVAEIIPIYAPAFENDVQGYINVVQRLVDEWRAQFSPPAQPLRGRGMPDGTRPHGNPLRVPNTVITQGYGAGTHAPVEVWGAIDLALDGDGDGKADPEGTWERPIYATHSGVVTVTANSYPAGNHVWVTNAAYRTGYAHLASFAVSDGQEVRRGDLIGSIGSTGMSSGPHLDYQVWVRNGEQWVNVNPLEYGALEPMP